MKSKHLLFLLFFAAGSLYADIRDSVCIVRPRYNEKILQFMGEAAKRFSQEGYSDIAELFEDAQKGVFGSGFFIRNGDKTYVLTNHHVAAYSSSLKLEMEDANGKTVTFENCPIIAYDEELDLAIAEVPYDGIPTVLTLASKNPHDGVDVWSAGYPGLGGKPLWQFGKGTVTNANVRLTAMIDPKKSSVLQHSAPIDLGNSGGPLLIKSGADTYEVIGINTAQAFFRQSTNFAIPASTIKNFINSTVFGSKDAVKKRLTDDLNDFLKICEKLAIDDKSEKEKEIVKRIRKLTFFISEDYAIQNGIDAYIKALRKAPSVVRKEIVASSVLGNPINGIRTAAAYELYSEIAPEKQSYKAEGSLDADELKYDDNHYRFVVVDENDTKVHTLWKEHFKSWKINGFAVNETPQRASGTTGSSKKSKKATEKKREKHDGFFAAIENPGTKSLLQASYVGFSIKNEEWKNCLLVSAFYSTKYFDMGGGIMIGPSTLLPRDNSSKSSRMLDLPVAFGTIVEGKLQLPVNINDVIFVVPHASIGGGMLFYPVSSALLYSIGLDVIPSSFRTVSVSVDFMGGVLGGLFFSGDKKYPMGVRAGFAIRF